MIDVGVATPLLTDGGVFRRRVSFGTADLANGPAMSRIEVLLALDVGAEMAGRAVAGGARCLITGDMGIGNTTPSAALIAAITGRRPVEVTGRGAGRRRRGAGSQGGGHRGRARAGAEHGRRPDPAAGGRRSRDRRPRRLRVGGAAGRVPVIVDGVIAAAAALVAVSLCPDSRHYLFAGHRSVEPGSSAALDHLGLDPLLDLDLRLGEGTGATLSLAVLQASAKLLREMATFDSAGVTEK